MIEKLIVGRDEKVRGARVKLIAKGKPVYIDRPVQKLYPLEIRAKVAQPEPSNLAVDSAALGRQRVKRAAALDSGWKTRVMLDPGDKQGGVCGGAVVQGVNPGEITRINIMHSWFLCLPLWEKTMPYWDHVLSDN